ncbi:MAG: Fpg/Nei family DNA glycosylase [Verrucomicrobiota bacterium]|nr:Fpg/Nei family DNA glycosylase [Verrucomicrobiota bacterium]
MPELAEVEYYRKRWDAGIGERIVAVQLHPTNRVFRGSNLRAMRRALTGSRLAGSKARGKQMLFRFSGDNWLGLHLGMSGTMRVEAAKFRAEKHDHLVLQQASCALVFRDPRQFGRVRFHHGKSAPFWWSAGPEIHSRAFSATFVREFLRRHGRAPIKAVLLRQEGFPGVGNWMADEILWRAHVAPATPAALLTTAQLTAFRRATRYVSRAALQIIGHDYSDPPAAWLIHQRWKRKGVCPRHRQTLQRATIGGRTTAWCAECQPASACDVHYDLMKARRA